jgi:uncharacterized protein
VTYALICNDKPGAIELRKANRDAHLAYVEETGVVVLAGPFLNDTGEMCGSLLLLDVESKAEAEDWAEGDPYARAGLFESVAIREWKKVRGGI